MNKFRIGFISFEISPICKLFGTNNLTSGLILAILILPFPILSSAKPYVLDEEKEFNNRHRQAFRHKHNQLARFSNEPTFDIQCKGIYDEVIFSKLDRICEDCYNLFQEPSLHSLCSQNCFSTKYFLECLDVLTLTEEQQNYKNLISQIYAPNPMEVPFPKNSMEIPNYSKSSEKIKF